MWKLRKLLFSRKIPCIISVLKPGKGFAAQGILRCGAAPCGHSPVQGEQRGGGGELIQEVQTVLCAGSMGWVGTECVR